MPLSPKRVIHRKVQRGREKGNATRDNHIDFGEIALVAMEPTWLDARVIEAARVAINRTLDRKGNVWIRVFPDKPITKKPIRKLLSPRRRFWCPECALSFRKTSIYLSRQYPFGN